ncbi:hypothetical protein [Candidatus Clostridium radicumherbarum]|uniref:Uncharacterized protein n=1 Tax=Candidatus Clostridium radicumherbarum TaxID=3381662 RepID=A0ABW8TRV4_9CLOT
MKRVSLKQPTTHFIDARYECQVADGTGGDGHFHYNFIVSPTLPDNISEIY